MNRFRPAALLVLCCSSFAACGALDDVEGHGARALRGRVGGRLIAEYDVGRSTHGLDLPSGILTADVVRVVNDYRYRLVLVTVEFNNRSDDPLHIGIADVLLEIDGQRHGAKLSKDLEMPPLRPRTRQTVEFTFAVDTAPRAGVYPLTIARVFPHAKAFPLRAAVPGTRSTAPAAPR